MADQPEEASASCAHEGLRQRKLRQTREHVEQVTVDLVDRLGYDEVSVEMICDHAEISPRTFYNYFGAKDAAILGYIPASIDADALQEFIARADDDIIDALLRLIASAERVACELGAAPTDATVQQRARLLFAVVTAVIKIALVAGPEPMTQDLPVSEAAVLERLRSARRLAVEMLQ